MTELPNSEEVQLDTIQAGVTARLSREAMGDTSVEVWVDQLVDELVLHFRAVLVGSPLSRVEVAFPRDWWQAVKERFAPQWVRDRWPVKYETHSISAWEVYPDVKIPHKNPRVMLLKDDAIWHERLYADRVKEAIAYGRLRKLMGEANHVLYELEHAASPEGFVDWPRGE